jgi:hypothetical protein
VRVRADLIAELDEWAKGRLVDRTGAITYAIEQLLHPRQTRATLRGEDTIW